MHVCEWRERREEEEREGKQNIHVSRERGNVRKKGMGTRAEGGTMATGEQAREGWREGRKRGGRERGKKERKKEMGHRPPVCAQLHNLSTDRPTYRPTRDYTH